jgi:hypothetical protein
MTAWQMCLPKEEVRKHIESSNRFIMALGLKVDTRVNVYLYDLNTHNGYFNPAKAIAIDYKGFVQMFDVALEQIIQSPDDPKVACQSYTATNGYYNCVKQKFEEMFINTPWFTDDKVKVFQYKESQEANQMVTRQRYMGEISQGVQSMNLVSYFLYF